MTDIKIDMKSVQAPASATGARFIRFQALQSVVPNPKQRNGAAPLAGLLGSIPAVARKRYGDVLIDVQGTQMFEVTNQFGKNQLVFTDAAVADAIIALAGHYAPLLKEALALADGPEAGRGQSPHPEPKLRLPLLSEDSPAIRCTLGTTPLPAGFTKGSTFKATISLSTVMVGCKSPRDGTDLAPTLLAQVRVLQLTK